MPSLRQLLVQHAPLLLIDAASAQVQVGWFASDRPARWETSNEEAGVGVFRCVEALGVEVGAAGAFLFCEGPGSMLGIRTVAMALRTWDILTPRAAYSYQSLALVAHALGDQDLQVIADARRASWHVFQLSQKLRRVPAAELAGKLALPEHFRSWTPLPANVSRVPYAVAELLPRVIDVDLFTKTESPDAFVHEEPSYVTWTPHVHRAPAPDSVKIKGGKS
jgi:tRNA threonylcarbamoyladenosine biosynthesis protein TsaB